MMYMNNSNDGMNMMLNSKLLEMLGTIDKSKIEQVSKLVQNMSKDDLNNLVSMLNKSTEKKDNK